jgi:multicomponent Na+:H+ antiporter subunit D
VAGIVVLRAGSPHIDNLKGLGRRAPLTGLALTIAALSLVGVPLTGGFVTKYYLAVGAIEAGQAVLLPFILVSSLLTAVYMWRCVQRVWFADAGEEPAVKQEAPWTMLVPTLALALACLVLGIFAWINVDVASAAAETLLGGGGGS